MEQEFLIEPRFRAIRNALYYDTGELNALVEAEYTDNFGFYQDNFGVYSYMTLNSEKKYVINYPKLHPFVWQQHKSCAWTPQGTLSYGKKEIEPCKLKLNEQNCYDEYFGSAFNAFIEWNTNDPNITMTAEGVQHVDMLTRAMVSNASIGFRMIMVAGKLHDLSSVNFETGVSTNVRDAFTRSHTSCQGWIPLVREKSGDIPHLETGDLGDEVTNDISDDGRNFTGSVVALHDALYEGAPIKLQDAITEGGIGGFDESGNVFPIMLVSPSIIRATLRELKAQKTTAMVNEPRIEVMKMTTNTSSGTREIKVYKIDETVIIPVREPSKFDEYLNGTSHFAYLTMSGVIQLGASFADIPKVREDEVGIMVQISEDAEDYGTVKMLSHALMAVAINDTDYITGDYLFATPA